MAGRLRQAARRGALSLLSGRHLPFSGSHAFSGAILAAEVAGAGRYRAGAECLLGVSRTAASFASSAAAEPPDGDESVLSLDEAAPATAEVADFSEADASGAAAPELSLSAISDAVGSAEAEALKEAVSDTWIFNSGFQSLLVSAHDALDLPWWVTIAGMTAVCRLMILPVTIGQVRNTYRMTQARPAMEQLKTWYEAEKARGNQQQAAKQYAERLSNIWAQYQCNPAKSLGSIAIQFPLFIGFFSSLRSFAEAKVPSLTHGGFSWCTDLTAADPTYVLPVLTSAILLLSAELGSADGMQGQPPETIQRLKLGMRFISVILVPVTLSMPAGVFMYWIPNNILSLVQALVLKSPAVRRWANLPELTATRPATPSGIPLPGSPLPGKPQQTFSQKPQAGGRKQPRKPSK